MGDIKSVWFQFQNYNYIYSLKSIKGHIQNFVQKKGETTSSSETKKGDVNNEKA